jgi:hypothetical protein
MAWDDEPMGRWDAPLTWEYFETVSQRSKRHAREMRRWGIVRSEQKPCFADALGRYRQVERLGQWYSGPLSPPKPSIFTRADGVKARRDIALIRRIHLYRLKASGHTIATISRLMDISSSRVHQLWNEEHRRRMNRWRRGGSEPFMRGDSPIHTESWTD